MFTEHGVTYVNVHITSQKNPVTKIDNVPVLELQIKMSYLAFVTRWCSPMQGLVSDVSFILFFLGLIHRGAEAYTLSRPDCFWSCVQTASVSQ